MDKTNDETNNNNDTENAELRNTFHQLDIENKIKAGAENMLQVFEEFEKNYNSRVLSKKKSNKSLPDDMSTSKAELKVQLEKAIKRIKELEEEVEKYKTNDVSFDSELKDVNGFEEVSETSVSEQEPLTFLEIINKLKEFLIPKNSLNVELNDLALKAFSSVKALVDWNNSISFEELNELFSILRYGISNSHSSIREISLKAIRQNIKSNQECEMLYNLNYDFLIFKLLFNPLKFTEKIQIFKLLMKIVSKSQIFPQIMENILYPLISLADESGEDTKCFTTILICELMSRFKIPKNIFPISEFFSKNIVQLPELMSYYVFQFFLNFKTTDHEQNSCLVFNQCIEVITRIDYLLNLHIRV